MVVPAGSAANPVIIRIKPGVYKELIYIQREKRFFHLVGDDAARTVITFDLYAGMIGPDNKPINTFRTPTVFLDADDFTAENITFENTAGPKKRRRPALAIRVDGDRAVFRNCRFSVGRTRSSSIAAVSISRIVISPDMSILFSAALRHSSKTVTSIAAAPAISRPLRRPTINRSALSSRIAALRPKRPK